ncbi:hypothetical protein CRUP_003766 [Coryphaenoides rupestris]|nr:hypothetical protein CRUP_003766 [Coryphaenoides rupestris]
MQHRPPDLEESNRALELRCTHLETALSEANHRVHELETQNDYLEKKLAEWPERYAVAAATVKSLQQRLEASKRSAGEKDAVAGRLRTRVQQLEESLQNACREADGKEARREREYKMLQDDNLLSTENKLVDAQEEISDLNRVRSKLESQVKQLEHENQARHRHVSHGNTQPSGAGKAKMEPGISHRKVLPPGPAGRSATGGRKSQTTQRRSPFTQATQATQTNQTPGQRMSPCPLQNDHAALPGGPAECPSTGAGWSLSLPERDQSRPPSRHQSQVHQDPSTAARDVGRRESQSPLTPVMRALMELDETRATQSRAPWVGSHRSTLGFVERRHKEPIQDHPHRISAARTGVIHVPERDGSGAKSCGGAERAAALLQAQRSLSPEGHRSSSLPPAAHRTIPPPTTPTKRETLLLPRSAISSPKRCPTENYSTAFSHMLPRQHHLQDSRLGAGRDPRRHSFHSSSPSKRLQFSEPSQQDVHTLAEAERLFDDLTQEKQQIEAALSRLPGSGGRVSLQNRLDEVALEDRLERLNRDLGSIRMTLKRFHVLRSSANI